VTAPLVTHSDVGRSAERRWFRLLTADRTSPYAFHQYWVNVPDVEVAAFLRLFSVLEREEIEAIEAAQRTAPHESWLSAHSHGT